MDLSIAKLRQLALVARYGSFSRAAADLNLSQPALSRSIAAIERRYGFQIFNRTGHGVEPTAAGAQVIAQAEPVLQQLRVLDSNFRSFGSAQAGTLSIGFSPLLASQLLARFAEEFFAPGMKAQLRAMIRPGPILLEELRNNAIEAFFFPDTQIEPTDELDIVPLGTIRPVCIVRREHPLATRREVSLADLTEYTWASSVDPPIPPHLLSETRFVCDNYHILREAVLRRDLVCICSEAFVADELASGTVRELHLRDMAMPATGIHMVKLRGRISSPLALLARDYMTKYLALSA